jgi:D-alanyl-D-alanine carboxypeptidase (penicillin-binding protein 5/6)
MLKSGNDCAVALAEYVSSSVDNFVDKMNEKAEELGLKDTHFVTVNGLDADEHYTTAVELAKMADYALKNETFKRIVGTKSYTVTIDGRSKAINNTNELLGKLGGVYGVKTGFTNGANRCLVTAIKRDNLDVICVVLGADTKNNRTRDSINAIEYVFSNYKEVNIEDKIEEAYEEWSKENTIQVIKGTEKYIETEIEDYGIKEIPIFNQYIENISVDIETLKILNSPISKGTKIGEIKLKVNNETRVMANIIASKDVKKKNEKDYFYEMLSNLTNYFEKAIKQSSY